jgi:uncharacterized protein YwgA
MIGRQREAVILGLIEDLQCNGSWCGETHIQKAAYFLQELLNVPLEIDFILYKHGPYSFDLKDILNAMQADLILQSKSTYPYGSCISPGLTSKQIKDTYPRITEEYKNQINFITEKLSNSSVSKLEKLATAYYVIKHKAPNSDLTERANIINQLKPHVSIEDAKIALNEALELVEEAKSIILCAA